VEATEAEATQAEATEATEATEVRATTSNYYALCWQLEATLRGRVTDPAAGARLLARSKALVLGAK
jgi:hypothetical protein